MRTASERWSCRGGTLKAASWRARARQGPYLRPLWGGPHTRTRLTTAAHPWRATMPTIVTRLQDARNNARRIGKTRVRWCLQKQGGRGLCFRFGKTRPRPRVDRNKQTNKRTARRHVDSLRKIGEGQKPLPHAPLNRHGLQTLFLIAIQLDAGTCASIAPGVHATGRQSSGFTLSR